MKIAVINLARSEDRRELVQSNLGRLGLKFEFFTGIDASLGQHIGISRYQPSAAWRDHHQPLTLGEIGCFASHYLLWRQCVEARQPLVIMEDDVLVDDGFVRALKAVPGLLSTYPLLRLGLISEGPNSVPILAAPDGFEVVSLAPEAYGTQCYVLSDVGAKVLLEHADVWSVPVDLYLDYSQRCGIGSYGLRPYYVRHADQHAYPSIIGGERHGQWSQDKQAEAKIRAALEKFLAARGEGRTLAD
jgi:glycosyl transferase family 25